MSFSLNCEYLVLPKLSVLQHPVFIELKVYASTSIFPYICKGKQLLWLHVFLFFFFFYDEALAKWKRKHDFVTLRLSFILLHILILWFFNVFIYLCVFIDIMILYVFIYIILFFSRYACTVCLNFVNSRLKMISHRQVAIVTVGLGEAQHVKAFPF